MPLSLSQLRSPQTEAQTIQFILDTLTSIGFRTGSWHEGSVQRNLITALARNISASGAAGVVADLVYNLIDNPNGDWLDLLGKTIYRLDRDPGKRAVRQTTFTLPPSSPPTTIENGTQVQAGGIKFSITSLPAPTIVAPGASADFEVTADAVGVDGNIGVLPRVIGKGGMRAAWNGDPTINGADREIDSRYWARCGLRFSALTYSVGLRAYEFWALTAAPTVKRARALYYPEDTVNPVHIVLDPGTLSERAQVAAYIVPFTPPRDNPIVEAVVLNPQTIKARPRVQQGTTAANVQTLLQAALDSMPIGGWEIANAPAGRLLVEKLTEALLCKGGSRSAGIVTPAADVVLGANEVIDPTYDIEVSYV